MSDDVRIIVTADNGQAVRAFRDTQGRLRDMSGRFVTEGRIMSGAMNQVTTSISGVIGSGGGGLAGLKAAAIGAGAGVGMSLLPALGAVVPAMAGIGVAAATLKVGFAGVSDAVALAGEDQEKYRETLKKMGPEQRDFTKTLVATKKEFSGVGREVQKAMLPGFTKAVKDARPVLRIFTDEMVGLGGAFGDMAEKAGRALKDSGLQDDLRTNLKMGTDFIVGMAGSVDDLARSMLDFGAKSQPTLDALQNLGGGLLDTGLPGMFKNLEQGIGGSADVIDGLAFLINDSLLPSLGKVSGSFADAFGPLLGETLKTAGHGIKALATVFDGTMQVLEPFADVAADVFRSLNEELTIVSEVAGSFADNVGGALMESLLAVAGVDTSGLDRGFRGLSDWVKENQGAIRGALFDVAHGITTMVEVGLVMLPKLYGGFRLLSEGVLTAIDGMVTGMAVAFGDVPLVGDMLKDWNKGFDDFARGFRGNLDDVGAGIDSLAEEAIPRLNRSHLTMNVDEAEQNLRSIKEQLKDPDLTKEREAKLSADKTAAEEQLAAARRALSDFDRRRADAKLGANSGGFWSAIRAIQGKVLGTAYINVQQRFLPGPADSSAAQPFRQADGGIMRFYADGGMEQHVAQIAPAGSWRVWGEPETGGEAYIPLAGSKRPRSRQVAEETVGILGGEVEWFHGGGVTKKEAEARKAAASDLTISYFGQRAGFKTTEFAGALGNADSVGELVGALNKWRSVIKQTTHGLQEAKLLKMLKSGGDALLHHQKKLADVNKSLDKARDKLDSLKDAAASLDASVKGGIISGANITRAATAEEGQVTINTLLSQARGDAAQADAFADALEQLEEKGVSGRIIEQIAEAGITGGGLETAQALLGADKGQISELNKLNQSIRQSADDAGELAADSLYGAGIKAAEGLVAGLKKKKKDIEAAMLSIAKSMEKALKEALGIKSPSRVTERIGDQTAAGFALGIVRNRQVRPAWESMLNIPRPGSVPRGTLPASVGGGGSGQTSVIQLQIGDTQLGEVIIDPLRKVITTRGGLKATFPRDFA